MLLMFAEQSEKDQLVELLESIAAVREQYKEHDLELFINGDFSASYKKKQRLKLIEQGDDRDRRYAILAKVRLENTFA